MRGQHGYRRHKVRLARNQGSTLFVGGHTPNTIVTYSFWRAHRLIAVDPNRLDKSGTPVSLKRYVKPLAKSA